MRAIVFLLVLVGLFAMMKLHEPEAANQSTAVYSKVRY